jgi:membrane protein YqaA with SNARE-associated domain
VWDLLISQFGLVGLFISSAVANTLIPLPFEAALFLIKLTHYNIWLWLTVASLGAWVGESIMYWIARGGQGPITDSMNWVLRKMRKKEINIKEIVSKDSNHWIREWLDQWGFGAVFVGAFTPLPMVLFDFFTGYLSYPFWKFSLACFLGKLSRYLVILLGGIAITQLF